MASNAGLKPRAKRNRDRPVTQLAEQSMRPVEEVIGWLEAGKLKGYRNDFGEWMVWGSQLDKWRELLKEPQRDEWLGWHSHHPVNAATAVSISHNHGGEREHRHDDYWGDAHYD